MKRLVFIISCCLFSVISVSAQSLDQKKICALKWTLQQTFYNKPEGQQIARMNVTEFKSFDEFQKNSQISAAIKKITNTSDLNRVKNIINATDDSNLAASVPSGAKKEFQADLDKVKAMAPVVEDDEVVEEESSEPVEESSAAPTPEIQTVEDAQDGSDDTEEAEEDSQEDAASTSDGGISLLEALLVALGVYVVLSLCIWLFIRSKKRGEAAEEMVSMEQYRMERVRLMERIKSLEIEMENMKSQAQESLASVNEIIVPDTAVEDETKQSEPVQQKEPAKQEVQAESPAPSLFPDAAVEPQKVVEEVRTPIVEQPVARPKFSVVMFYPVPVDGMFVNGTTEIEPGKSLYMMKTSDNVNATFQILNTPEAIAAALVSMNDMVKPACKVLNTVADPVEILAEKLGTAVREGDGWRIMNKAVVRLI